MAHRDYRGEEKEVLQFESHYFLEEGQPQGILPSITANCGEINHKANKPLDHETDQQSPMQSLLLSTLPIHLSVLFSLQYTVYALSTISILLSSVYSMMTFLSCFYFVNTCSVSSVCQRTAFHILCCAKICTSVAPL